MRRQCRQFIKPGQESGNDGTPSGRSRELVVTPPGCAFIMGRFNNKRAQQRAAQERSVPSRARFSKGPPSKGRGRGRGRGRGDDEGRGGRGGRYASRNASSARSFTPFDNEGLDLSPGEGGAMMRSSRKSIIVSSKERTTAASASPKDRTAVSSARRSTALRVGVTLWTV